MAKQNEGKSGGIGVLGLLGVAFVVLKLTGVIDWSWWWVTLPFWGGLVLGLVIIFLVYIVSVVIEVLESSRRRS
ncbi:hypothetical protein [Paenibacillus humicus]|uniref:hypothetical protein n=1 Tax=Paenibacillus humicus TaxID=412861 RepID=UPI003D2D04F3